MSESLKDKTVKGVAWSGIDNVVQMGVTFVVSIVLARLLSPDDYGLLGLIAVFTAVCQALINGGFTTALIPKKDATDDDYNTVFISNLGMSLFLYIVIFLCFLLYGIVEPRMLFSFDAGNIFFVVVLFWPLILDYCN